MHKGFRTCVSGTLVGEQTSVSVISSTVDEIKNCGLVHIDHVYASAELSGSLWCEEWLQKFPRSSMLG